VHNKGVVQAFRPAFCSAILVAAATLLQAQSRTEYRPVSSDTEHFIRAAIADRFKAGDIPDLNLLPDRTRVLVRKELVDAKVTLTADALPNLPAMTFEIISLQEAEALARRTGRDVVYLTVDNPCIDGDAATISFGIDVAMPRKAGMVNLCCCTGRAEYRLRAGTWVFVKWRQMICS